MRKKILLLGALLCVSAVAFGEEEISLKLSDFSDKEHISNSIAEKVKANGDNNFRKARKQIAEGYVDELHRNGLLNGADELVADNSTREGKAAARIFSDVADTFVNDLKLSEKLDDPTKVGASNVNARIFENRLLINELDEKVSEGLEETMDIVTDLIADESNKIDENATAIEFLEEKVDVNFDVLSDETIRNERNIARNTQDIKDLRKDHNRGMAQMAAMASVDFGNVKARTVKVGAAVGQHSSETAVAVGVAVAPTDALMVNAKWSTSANSIKKSTLGLGATYEFNF